MRFKRTGWMTKVLITILMIYMTISLLNLHGQIQSVQKEREVLQERVAAQKLENQQLSEAIENSDNPAMLESVARKKGYVKPGETMYVDVAN